VRIGVDVSQDKQKGEKGRRRCSEGHGTRCDDGAPRGRRIGAHRDGAAKGRLSGQTRPAATPRGQAAAAPVTGVADLGRLGPNRPTGRHAGPLTGRLISLQFKNFIFTRSRLFNSAYLYLRPLFCFSL